MLENTKMLACFIVGFIIASAVVTIARCGANEDIKPLRESIVNIEKRIEDVRISVRGIAETSASIENTVKGIDSTSESIGSSIGGIKRAEDEIEAANRDLREYIDKTKK